MGQLLGLLGVLYLVYSFGIWTVVLYCLGCVVLVIVLGIAFPDSFSPAPRQRRGRRIGAAAKHKALFASPPENLELGHVQSGLVIDEPWISKILAGEKVWEMRSKTTRKRGRIALVRKGSGMLVGLATIKDVLGPFDDARIEETFERHKVPTHAIGKWRYAWVLGDVIKLPHPIPYVHKPGAVIFVNLDAASSNAVSDLDVGRAEEGLALRS